MGADQFLEHLLEVVPYRIHTILSDNGIQFAEQPRNRNTITSRPMRFDMICEGEPLERHRSEDNGEPDRAPADQTEPPMDQRSGRADEPHDQGRHRQALPLRKPRAAPGAPRRLHGSLQLCPQAQDPERPHALRMHLQNLDIRARSIHPRPNPPDAGTEHLVSFPSLYLKLLLRTLFHWDRLQRPCQCDLRPCLPSRFASTLSGAIRVSRRTRVM